MMKNFRFSDVHGLETNEIFSVLEGKIAEMAFDNGHRVFFHSHFRKGAINIDDSIRQMVVDIHKTTRNESAFASLVQTLLPWFHPTKSFFLCGYKELRVILMTRKTVIQIHIDGFTDTQVDVHVRWSTISNLTNANMVRFIRDKLVPLDVEETYAGQIYMIKEGARGYEFSRLGELGKNLVRENYEEATLADVDFVKEELSSPYPTGRIHLFHGPTGTGKSHIIRDIINLRGCTFLYFQASLLRALNNANLIEAILEHQEGSSSRVVMIIEEADELLIPRGADNHGNIAALLNLGDGLPGEAVDLRFILTTNKKVGEMDEAVSREGRLSSKTLVDTPTATRANAILHRLVPDRASEHRFETKAHLGQIYKVAKKLGWAPERPSEPESRTRGYRSVDGDEGVATASQALLEELRIVDKRPCKPAKVSKGKTIPKARRR